MTHQLPRSPSAPVRSARTKASTRSRSSRRRATCSAMPPRRRRDSPRPRRATSIRASRIRPCAASRSAWRRWKAARRASATGSGMAAILATCMALLKAGDHIVCSDSVFGSTIALLNRYLVKFGVEVTYVRPDDNDAWRAAITPQHAHCSFLETPSNPLSVIADIRAIADIAHERGVLLAVDNCFCTPALQKPFELGADLVIHSATKYLDGQGRCVGGAVVGNAELVGRDVFGFIRSAGPSMSPFNAWVFLKGLETLELRMHAHSAAALELARWLERQPGVRKVHYAGLESHPQHALARRQQIGLRRHHRVRGRARPRRRVVVHRCDAADVDHRESRRREDHDHASGEHDAFAHHGGRARARRHHGRSAAHLGRPRTPRRSQGRSGARASRRFAECARCERAITRCARICFDLDNTLWDVWPVIVRAEQAMYDFLAQRYPRVVAAHDGRDDARGARADRGRSIRRCATTSRSCASRRCAITRASSATRRRWWRRRSTLSSRRATRSSCTTTCCRRWRQLRTRYRLFTASNGNADLAKIGLAHFFERSIAARQVGALKPDPVDLPQGDRRRPTWHAHEVVYVGDDPHLDVEGARGAGMQAIWINRAGQRMAGGDRAARRHTVRSLDRTGRSSGVSARVYGRLNAAVRYIPLFNSMRPIALPRRLAYIPRRSLCLCPLFSLAWPAGSLKTPPFGQLLKNPTRPRT